MFVFLQMGTLDDLDTDNEAESGEESIEIKTSGEDSDEDLLPIEKAEKKLKKKKLQEEWVQAFIFRQFFVHYTLTID